MKTFGVTLVLAALAGFGLVNGSPAVSGLSVSRGDVADNNGQGATSNMTWVGRIFPGDSKPTTIVGDLKTIYDEILSLNPKFAKDFADEHPGNDAPHGAIPREAAEGPDDGTFDCDADVSSTTWGWCKAAVDYLTTIGNGAGTCTVAAQQCSVIYCDHQCRVKVCNFEDTPFNAYCRDIATDVGRIHEACPKTSSVWPGARDWFGGVLRWPGQHETEVSLCIG